MKITKKIIFIISIILFAIPIYAVDMCASDNAVVVVLDPNIVQTSNSADAPTSTWRLSFSYGTITGISACLSYPSSQGDSANNGSVFGGEREGRYCWCKMTHPAVSKWMMIYDYSSGSGVSGCVSACHTRCMSSYVDGSGVNNRKNLFKTIAN